MVVFMYVGVTSYTHTCLLDVTKAFHDHLEPFIVWMDKSERKQSLAPPIAADLAAMATQKSEQQQVRCSSLQIMQSMIANACDVSHVIMCGMCCRCVCEICS